LSTAIFFKQPEEDELPPPQHLALYAKICFCVPVLQEQQHKHRGNWNEIKRDFHSIPSRDVFFCGTKRGDKCLSETPVSPR